MLPTRSHADILAGAVTLKKLQYCRRNVQCTQDPLNCAKAEFELYGLDDLLRHKAYSPASPDKAIFRASHTIGKV